MKWRETGMPCSLCGAARSCDHSQVDEPRQLKAPEPDKVDGRVAQTGLALPFPKRVKVSGGGRYKARPASHYGPRKTV